MARSRRPNEPSSYYGQPQVPEQIKKRFDLIRAVLGERTTISEAAKELGIARVNMQTLVHRAEAAVVDTLQPRATGPTPKSPMERALEERLAKLEKENQQLHRQLQAADEMMMAAGEIIRSLRGLPPEGSRTSSPRSKRSAPPTPPPNSDEDPEPETSPIGSILRRALNRLTRKPREVASASRALGVAMKTIRRWLARLIAGEPLIKPRGGRMRPGSPESEQRVRAAVVELHGLAGAESLARNVEGVSRRRAAQIKREVLSSLERDRKHACARVEITEPGVVRGFDAMHLVPGFALNVADACIPFRTTCAYAERYDAQHVARVLEGDFKAHGAPLVLRDDCASCHTAPDVLSVLEAYGVTLLQGPPYYAQYYGQHERQNREHRAWLAWIERTSDDMQAELDRMKKAVNERWLRPTLNWSSAAQAWQRRRHFDHERSSFLDDVADRAARLHDRTDDRRLAMRLAIEQALIQRGYLRITHGRKALCE
jgi:hypothetical protein